MAALSFPRLFKSIYGTFTLFPLSRPLLRYSHSQICRHSSSFSVVVIPSLTGTTSRQSDDEVQPLSTSSLLFTSQIDPRKRQKARKFHCGLECASFSGQNNGGSALFTTSAADNTHEGVAVNVEVAIPLCERPATYITYLEDLLQWRRKAEQLAGSVGSEFYDADGGPDSSDLLRELEWLLDDAVAACCRRGRESDVCVKHWEACSWRDVKACLPGLTIRNPSPVSMSSGNENSFKEEGDASQESGAFSTLLKERYTDPVSELAADGACCCDSLRDSLADMAAGAQGMNEMTEEKFSSVKPSSNEEGKFPDLGDAVKRLDNKITNAHVLLRTSIEELEKQWVERVLNRRPFQYVVGCVHWRDLVLSVQEGVLIPRPETEQMIDLTEAAIAANPSLAEGVWADLGTGSGALAVALARLLPPSGSVLAVDASEIAVAVARRNVEHYEVEDRVTVVHGSWFSPLENQRGKLAGVMSNPPYIPSANIAKLQAEVGKHEPQSALDGGEDGLNDLRQICQGSSDSLRAGGFLVLETNGGKQAEAVADLLRSLRTVGDIQSNSPVSCFQEIRTVQDFAGIMRFVVATRC